MLLNFEADIVRELAHDTASKYTGKQEELCRQIQIAAEWVGEGTISLTPEEYSLISGNEIFHLR